MRLFLLAFALSLVVPELVAAQSLDGLGADGTASVFSISVLPEHPLPLSTATLSFPTSLETANATLSVRVDGKAIYQGSVKPVSITVGKAGAPTRVSATLTNPGGSYDATLSIQPQDVVLVAEPIASVSPLYSGKPSIPLDGTVRMVAFASLRTSSGIQFDPSSLSYIWTVDDTLLTNASGIGKNVLVVASPFQYRSRTVSVTVTSGDGTLSGGASTTLSPADPHVRIYENDPLLGIRFERALSSAFTINTAEQSFYGAAFNVPTSKGTPNMNWFLNGEAAQTGSTITLRPTGSGAGTASLSFVVSGGESTTATGNLSIIFGNSGSNFFGL
jgi:hypothetical protein